VINALTFDVEDWFQAENLQSRCPFEKWDTFESGVEKNTENILALLKEYKQKATFFILGWAAEKNPGLVKRIHNEGHEIASHGYRHQIIYKISPRDFRRDLERSKKLLEDILGTKIIGYRAPNFSITKESQWAIDVLKEMEFQYDSSIFPTSFHDRYGFKGVDNARPFKFENGLLEFPLTTYRFLHMNFPLAGGGYFRLLPYGLLRSLYSQLNKEGERFIFYLHPWELDREQPRVKIKAQYYLRHYVNIDKTEGKLRQLLNEFQFQPLKSLLNQYR
jgi:polysaccharide deacetylase family protein (PEP-CTERM system associated)